MALETASFLHQLEPAYPSGTDRVFQGDDHLRLIKAVLRNTFPNITGAVTATQAQLNSGAAYQVPIGAITLWYGAADALPTGWAICDGSVQTRTDGEGTITTPDMRGRVPIGADSTYAAGTAYGELNRSLTVEAAGAHAHSASTTSAGTHNHGGQAGATTLTNEQIPRHTHMVVRGVQSDLTLTGGNAVAYHSEAGDNIEYLMRGVAGEANVGVSGPSGGGQAHTHGLTNDGAHTHSVSVAEGGSHAHTVPAFNVLQPARALHFIMKI